MRLERQRSLRAFLLLLLDGIAHPIRDLDGSVEHRANWIDLFTSEKVLILEEIGIEKLIFF